MVLLLLLTGVYFIAIYTPGVMSGELWGYPTLYWLLLALLIPILHQIYVVLCWRLELYTQRLSVWFGEKAFAFYKRWFTILILSRPITLVLLALSNKNTLVLDPYIALGIVVVLLIPSLYLFYSVKRYFGFDRAFGIDHFQPEKFRNVPLVNKGIFRFTDNGMYTCGFLLLYLPALIWLSQAALLVALFQHLYIWVHHYCTEKPDMKVIYGS